MQIAGRSIGPDQPPYIVAEVGCNHSGQLDSALKLIKLAKQAGANAVKFQAYTEDTITIDSARPEFRLTEGPWKGRTLYQLYRDCKTPFHWFELIASRAREAGITWFASVFDKSAVDILMKLDVPAFKIASFELVDLPLIEYVAQTGKPIILSTGMASCGEIDEAVDAAYEGIRKTATDFAFPEPELALLHCISGYPTPPDEANLLGIGELRQSYPSIPAGISDHTVGLEVPIAATTLGACIIEKHFKPQWFRGPDTKFSIAPVEFRKMVTAVHNTWDALQPVHAGSEEASRPLRRSLYVVKEMTAGESYTEANVRSIRPGAGLPPKELPNVLGKTAARDIPAGTPLTAELLAPAPSPSTS